MSFIEMSVGLIRAGMIAGAMSGAPDSVAVNSNHALNPPEGNSHTIFEPSAGLSPLPAVRELQMAQQQEPPDTCTLGQLDAVAQANYQALKDNFGEDYVSGWLANGGPASLGGNAPDQCLTPYMAFNGKAARFGSIAEFEQGVTPGAGQEATVPTATDIPISTPIPIPTQSEVQPSVIPSPTSIPSALPENDTAVYIPNGNETPPKPLTLDDYIDPLKDSAEDIFSALLVVSAGLAAAYLVHNVVSGPGESPKPPRVRKKPEPYVFVDKKNHKVVERYPGEGGVPGYYRLADALEKKTRQTDRQWVDEDEPVSYSDWAERQQRVVDANPDQEVKGSYARELLEANKYGHLRAFSECESAQGMINFEYDLSRESGLPVSEELIKSELERFGENAQIYINWGNVKDGRDIGVRLERERRERRKPGGGK